MDRRRFLQFSGLAPLTAFLPGRAGVLAENRPGARETQVVRWTANRDRMNFRYDFLENLEHINPCTAWLPKVSV